MNKCKLLTLVLCFFATASFSQNCQGNLFSNPGFENGLNSWTSTQDVTISSDANSGNSAARLTEDGVRMYQFVPVQPNREYRISGMAKSNGFVNTFMKFLTVDYAPNNLGRSQRIFGSYTNFEQTRTAPSDAAWLEISFTASNDDLLLDDICLVEVGSTPPPSACSIAATNVSITPCDDRNTSDPSDDIYDFVVDVAATNGGTGYTAQWIEGGVQRTFNRTYPVGIGQQFNRISNGILTLTLTDNSDPNCQTTVQVVPPAPCSSAPPPPPSGGNGTDLQLTATGTPTTVAAWANATVTFTLTNTGNQTSSGIEVDFTLDAGGVLQGGNEFDASQGTLQSFWTATPVWQVGNLAPGQSATIDLNIFTRTSNEITIYGQVSQANGSDPDSTPGNGSCCVANEDDEAAFNFNGSNPPPPPPIAGTDLRVENVRLATTPPVIIGQGVSVFMDGIIDGTPLNNNQFPITYTLYLSTDRTLSGNDVRILDLGIGFGPGLQFGGQVPTTLTPGNYYMIVEIDSPNNIAETNENNNWTASTATVAIQNLTPPANLPDLRLANLSLTNAPAAAQILNYNFDLINGGNGNAIGNFSVKGYISQDNVLSSDDIQDGIVPTGNFGVGTVGRVPGASTLPSNLSAGNYYLILKVDADDQITESNEDNNTVSTPFTIQPTTGGSACSFITEYNDGTNFPNLTGSFSLTENGAGYQMESFLQTRFNPPTFETQTYNLNLEGAVQSVSNVPSTGNSSNVTIEVLNDFRVEMVFGAGAALPAGTRVPINVGVNNPEVISAPSNIYQTNSGGYAFGLFIVEGPSTTISRVVVQTDSRGQNVQLTDLTIASYYNGFSPIFEGPDGTLFFRLTTSGNFSLFGVPGNGAPAWGYRVASDTPSSTWNYTELSLDGKYAYTAKTDNQQTVIARIDVLTGAASVFNLASLKTPSLGGNFRQNFAQGIAPTPDGGLLMSMSFNEVTGNPRLSGVIVAKLGAAGNIVWSREFNRPTYAYRLTPVGQTSDGGALFIGTNTQGTTTQDDDLTVFVKTTETGALAPLCSGTPPPPPPTGNGADIELSFVSPPSSPAQWSSFPVTLMVSNTGTETVTGIGVKFTKADEVVYSGGNEFTSSQGDFFYYSNERWTVGQLAPGESATLTVNYFRLSANGFTAFAEIETMSGNDVDSSPSNGNCCTANEDDEAALQIGNSFGSGVNNRAAVAGNLGNEIFAIVNASPNPTTGRFNLEVYSNENQTSEITVVDILGKPIFQKEVNLNEGHNNIPIDLENGTSGMMIVKMTPFHPYLRQVRVMKVRE